MSFVSMIKTASLTSVAVICTFLLSGTAGAGGYATRVRESVEDAVDRLYHEQAVARLAALKGR